MQRQAPLHTCANTPRVKGTLFGEVVFGRSIKLEYMSYC
jgi:hypothetical protein